MFEEQSWRYKGYSCSIEMEIEYGEPTRAFHIVFNPEGNRLYTNITPYDFNPHTVELWIDAGCPKGRCIIDGRDCGNWTRVSLKLLCAGNLKYDTLYQTEGK